MEETVNGIVSGRLTRVPILGLGGIGKTSLASAIIDHKGIHAMFGEHRYFIKCSSIWSTQEFVNVLIQMIIGPDSLKESSKNPLGFLLHSLAALSKTLIVLDNFETVCHVENQQDIVDMLVQMVSKCVGMCRRKLAI